jgi:hypothetical protein
MAIMFRCRSVDEKMLFLHNQENLQVCLIGINRAVHWCPVKNVTQRCCSKKCEKYILCRKLCSFTNKYFYRTTYCNLLARIMLQVSNEYIKYRKYKTEAFHFEFVF